MRVFFNLANGSQVISDEAGVEVVDVENACATALAALEELANDDPVAAQGWAGWRLNAVDGSGALLFSTELDFARLGGPLWAALVGAALWQPLQELAEVLDYAAILGRCSSVWLFVPGAA
jgi:hypothetical protein